MPEIPGQVEVILHLRFERTAPYDADVVINPNSLEASGSIAYLNFVNAIDPYRDTCHISIEGLGDLEVNMFGDPAKKVSQFPPLFAAKFDEGKSIGGNSQRMEELKEVWSHVLKGFRQEALQHGDNQNAIIAQEALDEIAA